MSPNDLAAWYLTGAIQIYRPLGARRSALTNGFPIVYCTPVCEEARPPTDLGHVGSLVFGILLALATTWSLGRPGAPGLVHAGRCGSPGGRDYRVAGEHLDHVGAPPGADLDVCKRWRALGRTWLRPTETGTAPRPQSTDAHRPIPAWPTSWPEL